MGVCASVGGRVSSSPVPLRAVRPELLPGGEDGGGAPVGRRAQDAQVHAQARNPAEKEKKFTFLDLIFFRLHTTLEDFYEKDVAIFLCEKIGFFYCKIYLEVTTSHVLPLRLLFPKGLIGGQ